MIKRILPIALLSAVMIGSIGCNSNGGSFKKVKGVEYKIVKDAPGKNAQMGDILEIHMLAVAGTDTLANTWKSGNPMPNRVDSVTQSGQFQAVFPMLSAGDSAIVEISCDTILATIPENQKQQLPPWLKKGNKIHINMSVVSIKSMEEFRKDMEAKQATMQQEAQAKAAQQMPIDDKTLQDYFTANNIKAQKTASGLYYTVQKPGSGAQITKGQTVSFRYTGKTLEGKTFDSNIGKPDPLTFVVGQGQMIPGVDEGVALLKKGAKAVFYLPSPLAYGTQSPSADIPANSILIFDVEVTDVKDASQAPAAPAVQ
jgi:FKBP-type peptidyl-prolyl cis-trans isomerase